jgi:signal transduction histidine kinase
MNVRAKLLVIIGFVALLPLSFLAYTTIGLHQEVFEQKIAELHVRSAKYGAKIVEANLERALKGLKPTIDTSIRWAELTESEREGALWLIYGQAHAIVAAALLDASGRVITGIAPTDAGTPRDDQPTVSGQDLQRLAAGVPREQTLSSGLARGAPLLIGQGRLQALPVGFRVAGPSEPWIVMVGYSIHEACAELAQERLSDTVVLLADEHGQELCTAPASPSDSHTDPALLERLRVGERGSLRYVAADGRPMLAAAALTPWGFRVVVTQPLAIALASSDRMRRESLLWITIGVLAALGAGLVLARSISDPLADLARGAEAVAKGDFSVRLRVDGQDELAGVSASFNRMSAEIEARETEIRKWNQELLARVEAKTAELREAQNALLESRKIAAMAALAAGVAHEINNPLTGVIGLTQVLRARARKNDNAADAELLASIEREALRVRDIVSKMLLLTQVQEARGLTELQPGELLREVLNSRREQLREAGVVIEEDFAPNLPSVLGDREQMSQVFEELIDNAIKAMRGKLGRLQITSQSIEGELVRLRVADNGRGIAPEHIEKVFEPFFTTKDDWHGQGLGLTAAYRVIEAHHGTIKLDSQLGQGTTVTIALPTKRQGAHLQ